MQNFKILLPCIMLNVSIRTYLTILMQLAKHSQPVTNTSCECMYNQMTLKRGYEQPNVFFIPP